MNKPLKYLFTMGVPVAALGLGALWMMDPTGGTNARVTYESTPVTRGEIRKIVSTSGPVRALVTVSIGSQISGQINTVSVDFNTEVKSGDVLATIDSRTFDAKVAQAKADLAAAEAALNNQKAVLGKTIAIKNVAERTQARQVSLEQKGFATGAALDTARRDAEVARADITVSEAQIESAKAMIIQRQATVLQAQIDLERTRIISPIEGTVISRTVDPGQTVAASLQAPELFKIAQDLRRIRIEAEVNEADVGVVAEGNPVTFTVDAYPDRTFKGKVKQVRLSAIELNNIVTYTVIIEATNDDRRLFPGMTANAQIEVARQDGALRVSNDALRFRPAGDQGRRNGGGRDGEGGNRGDRQVARLKRELELTDVQEQALQEALTKVFAQRREARQQQSNNAFDRPEPDQDQMRQQMQSIVEQTLTPMLSEPQKLLLERWKRGRENTKSGTVFVLNEGGSVERRMVRLGVSDDQFTEIKGGQLNDGEKVAVRVRTTAK